MFAYIPARGGSKRIPKKNIKYLGDKPIILHVIRYLQSVDRIKAIAVSSEDSEILNVVKNEEKVITMAPREKKLASDFSTIKDLIFEDIPRYTSYLGDENVLLASATAALVSSIYYQNAINLFEQNMDGLVMAVGLYENSPFLAMTFDENRHLKPLFPEKYLMPTKNLQQCCVDCGCFYLFNNGNFIEKGHKKLLDLAPICPIIIPANIGIDIDTPGDWGKLETNYHNKLMGV